MIIIMIPWIYEIMLQTAQNQTVSITEIVYLFPTVWNFEKLTAVGQWGSREICCI